MDRMLSEAEYNHIMQNKSLLRTNISVIRDELSGLRDQRDVAVARLDTMAAEMELYTNFLSDAITEYEEAHPPEV